MISIFYFLKILKIMKLKTMKNIILFLFFKGGDIVGRCWTRLTNSSKSQFIIILLYNFLLWCISFFRFLKTSTFRLTHGAKVLARTTNSFLLLSSFLLLFLMAKECCWNPISILMMKLFICYISCGGNGFHGPRWLRSHPPFSLLTTHD